MLEGRNKISLRQSLFLFLTMTFSPLIRIMPTYTAKYAKQASWLTPLASIIPFVSLILVLSKMYKANPYKEASYMDIICDITGKFLGRVIIVLYGIWITLLLALNVRYYGERILSTVSPNTNLSTFIVLMLLVVGLVLHSKITVIARMNEIILPLTILAFIILFLLLIPNMEIENLLPVSYLDIFPVIRGSQVINGIWGYLIIVFFIGKINNKEKIKNEGFKTVIFLVISTIMLAIMTIGTVSYKVTERLPIPFYTAVKGVSVFKILDKIESVVVSQWILADFILISVLSYVLLEIIKFMFKLKDIKPLIIPLLLFLYFGSLLIANSRFELSLFSNFVILYVNLTFEFILPFAIFIVGKLKKAY